MLLESIRRLSSPLRERNPSHVGMPGYARRLSPPPPPRHLCKTLRVARDVLSSTTKLVEHFSKEFGAQSGTKPTRSGKSCKNFTPNPNCQVRCPQITSIARELITFTYTCHLETERLLHSAWTSTSHMQRHHPSRVLRKDPTRLFQSWSKSHF